MPDRVPIDASRLRAAVSDERYWNAAHPERAAWRRWVAEGYQALYSDTGRAPGGTVHLRAYVRDGHAVAAHVRSEPVRDGAASRGAGSPRHAEDGSGAAYPESASGLLGLVIARRNLLDSGSIVPVMARRRPDGIIGRRTETILEGGGGGGGAHRSSGGQQPSRTPSPPAVSPRSQELVDIVAPAGRATGTQLRGATQDIRTLPGGQPAAEEMFRRLTAGRIASDITPRGYPGQMYRLEDGTIVGYRPQPRSGSPAIDINIPGFPDVTKLHF